MSNKVTICLVGYGYWGKIVERHLLSHPGYNLVSVIAPRLENQGIYTSHLDKALADPLIQAVFVAVPLSSHGSVVSKALQCGKHVLCEKPLAPTFAETKHLFSIAEKTNVVLQTNYIYTNSYGIHKLHDLLPLIGAINYASFHMTQLGRYYHESVFQVIGCHMLSILDLLFGIRKMHFQFIEYSKNSLGVCETGQILFHRDSLHGNIFISLNSVERERKISIMGEKGGIVFNPLSDSTITFRKFERRDQEGVITSEDTFHFDETKNLVNLLDSFLNIINGKQPTNKKMTTDIARVLDKR